MKIVNKKKFLKSISIACFILMMMVMFSNRMYFLYNIGKSNNTKHYLFYILERGFFSIASRACSFAT